MFSHLKVKLFLYITKQAKMLDYLNARYCLLVCFFIYVFHINAPVCNKHKAGII